HPGESHQQQDAGRDHERLAAQLGTDLALGDEPDGGCGVHRMTSLKIWARDGCCGAKFVTTPRSTALRSTRCAVAAVSTSNTADPPSKSITVTPGSLRS